MHSHNTYISIFFYISLPQHLLFFFCVLYMRSPQVHSSSAMALLCHRNTLLPISCKKYAINLICVLSVQSQRQQANVCAKALLPVDAKNVLKVHLTKFLCDLSGYGMVGDLKISMFLLSAFYVIWKMLKQNLTNGSFVKF